MKIYLIRHGQTDWNLEGRFQGREDIMLNATGIAQAKECGQALAGEAFKAVITSPLIRARKTAEIIAEIVQAEDFIVDDAITERDFKAVSGMTKEEREAFYASGGIDDKEPFEDVCNRMIGSIKKYGLRYYDNNIIMVSHGASINSVLWVLSGGETGTGKLWLKNTCINIIDCDREGNLKLEHVNLSAKEYMAIKRGTPDS